jgi:hypothetical protein
MSELNLNTLKENLEKNSQQAINTSLEMIKEALKDLEAKAFKNMASAIKASKNENMTKRSRGRIYENEDVFCEEMNDLTEDQKRIIYLIHSESVRIKNANCELTPSKILKALEIQDEKQYWDLVEKDLIHGDTYLKRCSLNYPKITSRFNDLLGDYNA